MAETDLINLTDEQLAIKVQNGQFEAFNQLMSRYQAKILRYVKRLTLNRPDSEDIVQETFLKAYQNINSFKTDLRWSPWLYRIAHNLSFNFLKRLSYSPLPFFDPDTLFPHPVAPDNPAQDILDKELKNYLNTCLDKLKPKYREVLIMRYQENLSYKDIAEILKIPLGTVSIRLKRGIEELKKLCPDQ
ncbi:MAG: RNA polymerase sigma factor [Patescibacteria group bacterium]